MERVSFIVIAFALIGPTAICHAEASSPFTLSYQVDTDCPSRLEFEATVAALAGREISSADGADRVVVRLRSQPDGSSEGFLSFAGEKRLVEERSCGEAMRVVAGMLVEAAGLAEAVQDRPRNTFSFSTTSILFGGIALEYERGVGDHFAFFLGPTLFLPFGLAVQPGESYLGLSFGLGMRLFPFGNALDGFYFALSSGISSATANANGVIANAMGWTVAGLVGGEWQIDGVFALGIGLGVQYMDADVEASGGARVGFRGFLPTVRLSLGATF